MGLALSVLVSTLRIILRKRISFLESDVKTLMVRSISFNGRDLKTTLRSVSFKKTDGGTMLTPDGSGMMVIEEPISKNNCEADKVKLETTVSFKNEDMKSQLIPIISKSLPDGSGMAGIEEPISKNNGEVHTVKLATTVSFKSEDMKRQLKPIISTSSINSSLCLPKNTVNGNLLVPKPTRCFPDICSPSPLSELDAAAVKVQKVYKSYRTRRNLADCAVVVEELWWKALDFAALKRSSVSFFDVKKQETAVSRWARARTRVAKVGKGLSKDEKAQKLALQHWLEAIDPRHRYGHNLHFYYDVWFDSESAQPFFYWLDIGNGKEVSLDRCSRGVLQRECIKYLGPKERQAYEVIVVDGKLVYKQSGMLVDTCESSKWIFVLSTSRMLYVGQKKKGTFQHSSFLSGGATTSAGRLVAEKGVLKAIWPYSGHYLPTEENFKEFITFLEDHNVDLTDVKRCAADDDSPSFKIITEEEPDKQETEPSKQVGRCSAAEDNTTIVNKNVSAKETAEDMVNSDTDAKHVGEPRFDLVKPLSCKWSTGAGPRIGCVRDYPTDLQFKALEKVNLSPRVSPAPIGSYGPIPSPRPSPKIRVSPRLSYMGLPSPRVSLPTLPKASLSPSK